MIQNSLEWQKLILNKWKPIVLDIFQKIYKINIISSAKSIPHMNKTFHSNSNIINSDKYYLAYETWDIGNLIT